MHACHIDVMGEVTTEDVDRFRINYLLSRCKIIIILMSAFPLLLERLDPSLEVTGQFEAQQTRSDQY